MSSITIESIDGVPVLPSLVAILPEPTTASPTLTLAQAIRACRESKLPPDGATLRAVLASLPAVPDRFWEQVQALLPPLHTAVEAGCVYAPESATLEVSLHRCGPRAIAERTVASGFDRRSVTTDSEPWFKSGDLYKEDRVAVILFPDEAYSTIPTSPPPPIPTSPPDTGLPF